MMRAKYLTTNNKKQPTEISEVLGKVIENAAVGVDVRQAEMIDEWAAFVPGDWAAGRPVGVREGVLLVVVPDGSTGSLLRYQTESLLTSISGRYGDGLVTTVRVQIERV
jgi:Dna[CI] antecedent, DciA